MVGGQNRDKKAHPKRKLLSFKRVFPDRYEVKNYLGIPMLVMSKENMFAHKLVALSERRNVANRDYFDLWFFLKNNWEIDKKIVELRTEMDFKEYIKKCVENVHKIDEKHILQGLGEILDSSLKNWVKNHLKKELIFLLNFYLENL